MHWWSLPKAYSYGGFKPWADIAPPQLKPGDTLDSRANKFQGAGTGCQYRDPPPLAVGRDVSTQGLSFGNVKPSDYTVPTHPSCSMGRPRRERKRERELESWCVWRVLSSRRECFGILSFLARGPLWSLY